MTKIPLAISWSGGKDSSLMLYKLLADTKYEIVELHTAISTETDRVSMHGISRELIQAQADAIGLPLHFISIEPDSTNAKYENALNTYYSNLKSKGINHIGFGDIFLEDLKAYRDKLLAQNGISGIYPLWQQKTSNLIKQFLALEFKTMICCAKQSLFAESICGRALDELMVNSFSDDVDPCGENGEFHSFVFEGPIFQKPLNIEVEGKQIHTYEHELSSGEMIRTAFEFANITLKNLEAV